jgi:hypothetical protein
MGMVVIKVIKVILIMIVVLVTVLMVAATIALSINQPLLLKRRE